jgi:DNA polymerase-3 subunit epsilon
VNSRDLVFIDTETTGLDPLKHELLELAAIRTTPDGREVTATYHALIRPTRIETADTAALSVNGYTPEKWSGAVDCETALGELAKLVTDAVVVGHNVSFDLGFINEAARAYSTTIPWYKYKIDTASLAWPLAVKGLIKTQSLQNVEGFFGMTRDERHRALGDADACRRVYLELCEFYLNKQ